MLIGVLSDTHLTDTASCQQLAAFLLAGPFAAIDAILHAGDHTSAELEQCFYPIPWYSVRGNMDHTLPELPVSRIVTFADKKIGLIHGWGGHDDLEERVVAYFAEQNVDALVYGHSHWPVCHRLESLLIMNPGSVTDRRNAPRHTVGILTIDEQVSGEIVDID